MTVTAIAAFTAAFLSLVNVAIGARLTRSGSREQWRREQEQPIVAKILTFSNDALREWYQTADAKRAWHEARAKDPDDGVTERARFLEHWNKANEIVDGLRYEVAQLDLLASRSVRGQARRLVWHHATVRSYMAASAPQVSFNSQDDKDIQQLDQRLVEATRADFGLDRVSNRYLRLLTLRLELRHQAKERSRRLKLERESSVPEHTRRGGHGH